MSVNIIELLTKQQGIDMLPKVDPNTQDITDKENRVTNLLLQALIPSVLAGFYKYSRNDNNAEMIYTGGDSNEWPDILFGKDKDTLLKKIAHYASVEEAEASRKMETIAENTHRLLIENAAPANGTGIKKLLTDQRHNILNHLPGDIGIGNALNDTTLDDRTNKMEGPVSSFMHAIEKQFSSTNIAEEKKP
jgi:hypothetical protein